jgi:peptidoglycan/xylan/chitin deacetylase (PgdA/CDA1 family)
MITTFRAAKPLLMFFIVTVGLLTIFLFKVKSAETYGPAPKIEIKEPGYTAEQAVPILLYHDVGKRGRYSVTVSQIREHFEYLKKNNIKVIPMQELILLQNENRTPTSKSVIITIDDGYISAFTEILPLAREFNYPITLFVYTDFITENSTIRMTWEKLRTLENYGFDIQSHTVSHRDLRALSNSGTAESHMQIMFELTESKKIIEQKLNKKITLLAFPYGYYTPELLTLARKAGYLRTFSTDFGANITTYKNFCYRRHHIKSSCTLPEFKKIIGMN